MQSWGGGLANTVMAWDDPFQRPSHAVSDTRLPQFPPVIGCGH